MLVATKRWMRATIDTGQRLPELRKCDAYAAAWCAAGYSYSIRGVLPDTSTAVVHDWDVNDAAAVTPYAHAVTYMEDFELYNFIEDAHAHAR